jgi:uncharacterized phage-associated protein
MSVVTTSNTEKTCVYVRLLGEGTIVFRPVPAELLEFNQVRLLVPNDYDPDDEDWEFKPDSIVYVEQQILGGESVYIAMKMNSSVFDVAAYILQQCGKMTTMKLQKLVYYCQAWSLVWDETPLFAEKIEAWINGPIVPELYAAHKGQFEIESLIQGDPNCLTNLQRETVDAVLRAYSNKSSQWLSDLTHSEDPWQLARRGLRPNERSNQEISLASMAEYYSAVASSGELIEDER